MPVSTDKSGQDPERPYGGDEETYNRDTERRLSEDHRRQGR